MAIYFFGQCLGASHIASILPDQGELSVVSGPMPRLNWHESVVSYTKNNKLLIGGCSPLKLFDYWPITDSRCLHGIISFCIL
jgi:hypothetical protein